MARSIRPPARACTSSTRARQISVVSLPTRGTAMPSAIVVPAEMRRLAVEHGAHRGKQLGLDADHLDLGLQGLHRGRDPGDEAAAAERHDHGVEIGAGTRELKADRPLPGDHLFIIVRMNEGEALVVRQLVRGLGRLGQARALKHDMGAEALGLLHLHERRRFRHHDRRRDAEALRVIGDALRMIARRHRDDAARALRRREARELGQGRRAP